MKKILIVWIVASLVYGIFAKMKYGNYYGIRNDRRNFRNSKSDGLSFNNGHGGRGGFGGHGGGGGGGGGGVEGRGGGGGQGGGGGYIPDPHIAERYLRAGDTDAGRSISDLSERTYYNREADT